MIFKHSRSARLVLALGVCALHSLAWGQNKIEIPRGPVSQPAPSVRRGLPPHLRDTDALNSCYVYLSRFLGRPVNASADSERGTVLISRGSRSGAAPGARSTRSGLVGIYFQAWGHWYFKELRFPDAVNAQGQSVSRPTRVEFDVGVRRPQGLRAFHLVLERARNPQGNWVIMGAARPYDIASLRVLNTGDFVGPNGAQEPPGNFTWADHPVNMVPEEAMQQVLIEGLRSRMYEAAQTVNTLNRAKALLGLPPTASCVPAGSAALSMPLIAACGPVLQSRDQEVRQFATYARDFIRPLLALVGRCAPAQAPSHHAGHSENAAAQEELPGESAGAGP